MTKPTLLKSNFLINYDYNDPISKYGHIHRYQK